MDVHLLILVGDGTVYLDVMCFLDEVWILCGGLCVFMN